MGSGTILGGERLFGELQIVRNAYNLAGPSDDPGGSMPTSTDRDFIRSLDHGLAVLEAFSASNHSLTVSQAAEATGLTRATARRVLLTLHRSRLQRGAGAALSPRDVTRQGPPQERRAIGPALWGTRRPLSGAPPALRRDRGEILRAAAGRL